MAPAGKDIRGYFHKPLRHSPKKPAPEPPAVQPKSEPESTSGLKRQVGPIVIRSSDDEESASDAGLEDLADVIGQSANRPSNLAFNGFKSPEKPRPRKRGKGASIPNSPLAVKPKLKFDMKMLQDQAEESEATEASVLRVKALWDKPAGSSPDSERSDPDFRHHEILESVVAEQDGASVEQVLQAVKRTEAINAEKRWEFFESNVEESTSNRPFPSIEGTNSWKDGLADPGSRQQLVLSDFAKEMVELGDVLPDELLLWMLDEICLERRDDLRETYARLLMASSTQIRRLVLPETIIDLFRKLGAKDAAIDLQKKVRPTPTDNIKRQSRDWSGLSSFVAFIGRASHFLDDVTRSSAMSILTRLCIDELLLENIVLLAAVRKTMEQILSSVRITQWNKTVRHEPSVKA
jgi:hypothetical protein